MILILLTKEDAGKGSETMYVDLAISRNGTILIPYVNNELIQVNGT